MKTVGGENSWNLSQVQVSEQQGSKYEEELGFIFCYLRVCLLGVAANFPEVPHSHIDYILLRGTIVNRTKYC